MHPISGRFAFILTLSYILTSNDGFSCSNINKLIICFAEMPSACKIFNNRPNTIMLASEEHLSSDKNNANIEVTNLKVEDLDQKQNQLSSKIDSLKDRENIIK